jgi:calcineurin-like phosphoesterase family protein
MQYFISDCHFGHKGSLLWNNGTVRSGFKNIKELENLMISNWNSVVSSNDEVYFLGDFAYKCSKNYAETMFWQLNGIKHLIEGNHDYNIASRFVNCWESISQIKQIDFINDNGIKQEIILCHYPLLTWKNKEHGSWHLHGHTHGSIQSLNEYILRHDCSVEVNGYIPKSLVQISNIMLNKLHV